MTHTLRHYIDIIESAERSGISESFETPFPYRWIHRKKDLWEAIFKVGDEEYFAKADLSTGFPHPDDPQRDGNWYDLSFGPVSDYFAGTKVLNLGGKGYRVFATAIAVFREFITKVKPELIMLSASKENTNRFRLYQKMAAKFSQELAMAGYEPCEAPEHRFAKTSRYFDTLAWRRIEAVGHSDFDEREGRGVP